MSSLCTLSARCVSSQEFISWRKTFRNKNECPRRTSLWGQSVSAQWLEHFSNMLLLQHFLYNLCAQSRFLGSTEYVWKTTWPWLLVIYSLHGTYMIHNMKRYGGNMEPNEKKVTRYLANVSLIWAPEKIKKWLPFRVVLVCWGCPRN